MKNGKPIIGMTGSYLKNEETERDFLIHSYFTTIRHFGGIPLFIPVAADRDELDFLLEQCDGIVLTGGGDIAPSLYGENILNETVKFEPVRDQADMIVCELALKRKLPILGICRGLQILNVNFGGTLYQDIPTQLSTEASHKMEPPNHRTCHNCLLEDHSPLYKILGRREIQVNSHHHQSIKDLAPGFARMGQCDDGVIEAIYNPSEKFVWGVQWHPERIWDIEDSSAKVLEAFIQACK